MDFARLVTLSMNGDEQAKSDLLRRAAQLVYARVFRSVKSYSVAEDVAQDALVAALTALPHLRNPRAFLPWLRRITDNAIADHFAMCQRLPEEVHDALEDVLVADDRTDRALEQAEERDRVRAALDGLPPKSRLAIELFYFHHLTSREVADFLRISDDAARAVLSRSRKELKRRMMTMTTTDHPEPRIRFSVKGGGSPAFRGPVFEHDSDTAKLYLAVYSAGNAEAAAASIGLSSERTQQELRLLEDMRLIVPQNGQWRATMPVVNETDRELVRVWAEPIADIVIHRLDCLYQEVAALSELIDGDLARSTVMTIGLIEAGRRPFGSLQKQMKVSAPDRGRFGSFSAAVFTCEVPGHGALGGGLSCGHSIEDDGESYTYYFHPAQTRRPGIKTFNQTFPSMKERDPGILDMLAHAVRGAHDDITPEMKMTIADELGVSRDRHDEFWVCLADLHAVAEREGHTRVIVPRLPLGPWKEYLSLLDGIGKEIDERITDAADDLRRRAVRCSFADCYFADSVSVFITYLEGMIKHTITERGWITLPDEADFSWGALIVA